MELFPGGGTPAATPSPSASGSTASLPSAAVEISARGKIILNAVMWVGYAIALGMLIFVGIKYVLGAADAKANMKNAIIGWILGAFIVFMATTIVSWVISAATDKNISGYNVIHALD